MVDSKHIILVSQKIIVVNPEGKILALRRSNTAPSNALKWDLPGGVLEWGENPIESARREVLEEAGITLSEAKPLDVEAHVNSSGEYWTTIAYVSETEDDKVKLSFEHDKFEWLTKEEFLKLEMSDKIRRFISNYSGS